MEHEIYKGKCTLEQQIIFISSNIKKKKRKKESKKKRNIGESFHKHL